MNCDTVGQQSSHRPCTQRRTNAMLYCDLIKPCNVMLQCLSMLTCFMLFNSFIADIYVAPLQVGLLRSASNPSTAEHCCFKLLKEFLGEYSRKL